MRFKRNYVPCRPFVAQIQKAQRIQKDARDQEIEKNLRQADVQSVLAKLESDIKTLKDRAPSEAQAAFKHAKDLKYVQERQKILDSSRLSGLYCLLVKSNHARGPACHGSHDSNGVEWHLTKC